MNNTLSRSVAAATLIGVGVAAAFAGASLHGHRSVAALPTLLDNPETLRETGLFTASGQIADGVLPFTPVYPLWSDGAHKERWLYLPAGASIDATNPDAWQFPVGTRVWKQFSWSGARIETRFMQRLADGWHYATYIWNAAGTDAVRAPATGAMSVEIARGVRHRIPSEADCRACHAAAPTPVLAFSALQLSSDRDPNAPHREAPLAGSVELDDLVARGQLRGLPASMLFAPPRIPGPPAERAALGYLHANCGGCHRSDGALAGLGMELAFRLSRPDAARTTTIAAVSHFMSPAVRIAPGAHEDSVLYRRISARTPLEQMPPLGTQIVDTEAQHLIAAWIDGLAPNTHAEENEK